MPAHTLPHRNGLTANLDNLVFNSPWSARVFGITLAVAESGLFTFGEFQQMLIESIATQEKLKSIDSDEVYYSCWIEALVSLLQSKQSLSDQALVAIEARIRAALQHQHDHDDHTGH
jgi:nitrile hydratase accessory protein